MTEHATMSQIAEAQAKHVRTDPAADYLANAERVLTELRKRIVDLEAGHANRKREVAREARDKLHALDVAHTLSMRRVEELVQRLQAMMD